MRAARGHTVSPDVRSGPKVGSPSARFSSIQMGAQIGARGGEQARACDNEAAARRMKRLRSLTSSGILVLAALAGAARCGGAPDGGASNGGDAAVTPGDASSPHDGSAPGDARVEGGEIGRAHV